VNSTVPETCGTAARANTSKRIVKNWLALICAIPIRSLRTEWSERSPDEQSDIRGGVVRVVPDVSALIRAIC